MSEFNDAQHYLDWYRINQNIYTAELEAVNRLQLENCIDLGSGPGVFHEVIGGYKISLDLSEAMLALVNRNEDRIQGDISNLPIRDNSIECSFISLTFCFIKELNTVAREIARITKRYLGVCIIPSDSPLGKMYKEKGERGDRYYKSARFVSREEIRHILDRDFTTIKIFSTLHDLINYKVTNDDSGNFVCYKFEKITSGPAGI
ncbi:hypothetical protein HS7_20980 [Sulfolobales archaeon HS-7]|nr:hypothetical protein HS7_20980 [Sulfolobales archaeon HS-7]